ncbi:hypothetical protein HDU79_011441 [Rhizoclosmatium sp. JEL0117]|nr:hypothetical protein HDU79_011441 [Rhizoclosmatium sp. JEL0117]
MKFSVTLLLVTATAFQALAAPVPGDDKYYEVADNHNSHESGYYAQDYSDYDKSYHTDYDKSYDKYDDAEKYYKRDGYSADYSPDYDSYGDHKYQEYGYEDKDDYNDLSKEYYSKDKENYNSENKYDTSEMDTSPSTLTTT